jgi:hypothetical protein
MHVHGIDEASGANETEPTVDRRTETCELLIVHRVLQGRAPTTDQVLLCTCHVHLLDHDKTSAIVEWHLVAKKKAGSKRRGGGGADYWFLGLQFNDQRYLLPQTAAFSQSFY